MSASQDDTQKNRIDTIARLEAELQSERGNAMLLREQLDALANKVSLLEARTSPASGDTHARIRRVEARLEEQSARLASLGEGRERSLVEIRKLEQELKLVAGERDSLRNELNRVEGMQSETIAFDEGDESPTATASRPDTPAGGEPDLPSIADLMAVGARNGPWQTRATDEHEHAESTSTSDTGWHELLPADLIVAKTPGEARKRIFSDTVRWRLIRTDVRPPSEYPLEDPLMTIGRSESADIQIDAEVVSRIHARLLRIEATIILEDAGSKNGVRINGERVERWPLSHGDTVQIGTVPFRFVDADKES